MRRDTRDVWPDDAPPGTFDISECSISGRKVTARIQFVCPNRKHCGVFMGPQSEPRPDPESPHVWGWNGDAEKPTLTPSIDCKDCWHGHIVDGVMK